MKEAKEAGGEEAFVLNGANKEDAGEEAASGLLDMLKHDDE